MDRPIKPSDLMSPHPPPPMVEPPSDSRKFVIKVKHGDTLRRIGAYVHGQLMDHNMNKLRAKIISLFKFSPDTEFKLTYTDEDGDDVTLDDDDELRDAVIAQHLNPLRINVELKSSTIAGIDASPEASSPTAANSPKSRTKPFDIQAALDEALKSVPEAFRSVILDLSGDALKVATSAPAFSQLVEHFSKLGMSNISQPFRGATGQLSGRTGDVPAKETNTTVSVGPTQQQQECGNIVQGDGSTATASVYLNQDNDRNKNVSFYSLDDAIKFCVRNSKRLQGNAPARSTSQIGVGDRSDGPMNRHIGVLSTVVPSQMDPTFSCWASQSMMHPHKRSHRYRKDASGTFHRGVQCDGCGMLPILGPRFKSTVKDDYDLCNFCFSQRGDEAEYRRIDGPRLFRNLYSQQRFPSSNASNGCGSKSRVKLESLFIQDVTVLDGAVMAPSTCFTKIWRMRNNGTVAWPLGTQLVWVGGDQFGYQHCNDLEIPTNGLPAEGELDIAVDFTAPSVPGQYVSYWRMSSPSGQRFGQRVWVLIKVDYSRPTTPVSSIAQPPLNLNMPPENINQTGFRFVDMNAVPLDAYFPEANTTCITEVEQRGLRVHSVLNVTNDGLFRPAQPAVVPLTSSDPLVDLSSASSPLVAPPSVPNPDDANRVEQIHLKKLLEIGFNQKTSNRFDLGQCMNDPDGFADDWDLLLSEMEEMGFSDKELNSKMLIKNGGSIKRAVLDLVTAEKS